MPTIRENETEDEFRTRIHKGLILLIEYGAACGIAAKMLRGAARCFQTSDSNSILWDTAASKYQVLHDQYKAELLELGVELPQGETSEEWPEAFG